MPNPKFHPVIEDIPKMNCKSALRFVVWWIAPEFCDELFSWAGDQKATNNLSRKVSFSEIGNPGDFGFSRVLKSQRYLHTYRDLEGSTGIETVKGMLSSMDEFLKGHLGVDNHYEFSCGFHFPVRTQYSTLHMQVRINSGNIVGPDGRGITSQSVIDQLIKDPLIYVNDSRGIRYRVTENIRFNLIAAAQGLFFRQDQHLYSHHAPISESLLDEPDRPSEDE